LERERVRRLLRAVRDGTIEIERALETLSVEPIESLGHATVDTHRALRRGFPEVIYGPGKTPEQIVEISRALRRAGQSVLVTRVGPDVFDRVTRVFPTAEDHRAARAVVIRSGPSRALRPGVTLVTAGTADLAVGEEAALTAELLGNDVQRIHDVGVAGLHRLLAHQRTLVRSRVIIVVAGMEGALPSVVSGLTGCPVVAVPTSTGYGTGAGGFAALFTMLNSCSAGVSVVNIDNGFGAGCVAGLINRLGPGRRARSATRKPKKSKTTKSN
jgi:pyridinium-3,5-biscarboxylic acid mononucleotide synthase